MNTSANANDEIAAIRFTDVEGHVELRFREDEQTINSSTEKRTSTEEEIFLLTHGYIYHPKFLKMDLGIGPLFTQSDLKTSSGNVSDDSSEYNLMARLRFLEEKPYPLLLYYDKDHPSVSLSLTDRFQQESEKYGFDFQLKQPLLPFNLALGASRQKTEGQGFDIRIDDITEQKIIRANIPMGTDGYGQLIHNSTKIISRSGFLSLPVSTTTIKTDATTFDSRVFLGDKNQFQWSNFLSYVEQSDVRPLKELRYTPQLRWTHSDDLESFYRLGYLDSDQVEVQTTNYSAAAGFRYEVSDRTNVNAEIHAEDNETTGLMWNNYGVAGNVTNKRDYSFGTLSLSAGWNYDFNDRQVTSNVLVRDLQISFAGTTPQFLPHDNILSSTTDILSGTMTVSRLSGGSELPIDPGDISTTCSTGIVVAITTIGTKTQVNICSASDAVDPYIFNYEYDPGGTVAYSSFIQSYQASLRLYQYSNLYIRWRDSDVSISSGSPTSPLDESTNTRVGARIDYPLYGDIILGGEVVYEEEEGTLISYDSDTADVYLQFGFLGGSMRLSTHHVTIDYLNTTEDVDLIRNAIQFRARPWNLFTLTADISDEKDIGGAISRQTKIMSVKAEWRIRKLIMLGEARVIEEQFGSSENDRSQIRFILRRDF